MSLEREMQPREVARVVMKQPGRAVRELEDVAELVEHGEAGAVLERALARCGERDDTRDQQRRGNPAVSFHWGSFIPRRPPGGGRASGRRKANPAPRAQRKSAPRSGFAT